MKRYLNILALAALCSGSVLTSCADDIQIGTLDESLYENVDNLKGTVRDASNGKASTIVELRKKDYSTTVEFSLPRTPKKGVDVTISFDADYLDEYNEAHGTSFKLYPADRIKLERRKDRGGSG